MKNIIANIIGCVLILAIVFENIKSKSVSEANCLLPNHCYRIDVLNNIVCRGFKKLSEIDLKWDNCPPYEKPMYRIYFYPFEKIILGSSLNWNSLELKNLSTGWFQINLENFKGFEIDSTSLSHFSVMKIFESPQYNSTYKELYIYESFEFLSKWIGNR